MPGMGEKIKDGDPGITVDGVPLDNIVAEEERRERQNDLDGTRKEEIGTKAKHKKKFRPRERFGDDPRKVKRRCRRLSEYEIRKEYGLKEKPFSSLTKNVMYVLFHAGDQKVGSRGISDEIGKPLPDVSSALSNIFNKLKHDNHITRERLGLAYQYSLTPVALEKGFDTLYRIYFPGQGAVSRKAPTERTGLYAEIQLPYKMASRNAIHILCQDPGKPIKTLEISDGLGKPVQNLSSTLKKIYDRMSGVGLLKKVGPVNRRSYVVDPLAAIGGSQPLIDFLLDHHDHWKKGPEYAKAYFKALVETPLEEEPLKGAGPQGVTVPEPSTDADESLVEREEEPTPPPAVVEEEPVIAPVVDAGDMAYLQGKVDELAQGLSRLVELSKVKDPDPVSVESKGAGDFNININVRFLVGRPN